MVYVGFDVLLESFADLANIRASKEDYDYKTINFCEWEVEYNHYSSIIASGNIKERGYNDITWVVIGSCEVRIRTSNNVSTDESKNKLNALVFQ